MSAPDARIRLGGAMSRPDFFTSVGRNPLLTSAEPSHIFAA